jgi:hypothetical protein
MRCPWTLQAKQCGHTIQQCACTHTLWYILWWHYILSRRGCYGKLNSVYNVLLYLNPVPDIKEVHDPGVVLWHFFIHFAEKIRYEWRSHPLERLVVLNLPHKSFHVFGPVSCQRIYLQIMLPSQIHDESFGTKDFHLSTARDLNKKLMSILNLVKSLPCSFWPPTGWVFSLSGGSV